MKFYPIHLHTIDKLHWIMHYEFSNLCRLPPRDNWKGIIGTFFQLSIHTVGIASMNFVQISVNSALIIRLPAKRSLPSQLFRKALFEFFKKRVLHLGLFQFRRSRTAKFFLGPDKLPKYSEYYDRLLNCWNSLITKSL